MPKPSRAWVLSKLTVVYKEPHAMQPTAPATDRFVSLSDESTEQFRDRLYSSIVESASDAIISKSLEGIIQSWNPAAERMFQYTALQAVGRHISFLIPADRAGEEELIIARLRAGEKVEHYETVRMRSGGECFPVSLTVSPIEDAQGKVVMASKIVRDISERRKADEAIRKSEQELADFFENANVCLHWVGPDGMILRANRSELGLLGYSAEKYVGHHISQFHADQAAIETILTCLVNGEILHDHPAKLICQDGSFREVLINSSVLFEDGTFVHTRCITRDVTAQRRAEAAYRASEQRMRVATQATAVGIWDWNILTGEIRWDPMMFQIYGIAPTPDGVVQYRDWSDSVMPDDLPQQEAVLQDTLQRLGSSNRHFRIKRRDDGSCRIIDSVETVRANDAGVAEWVVGTNLDVTERRRTEQALRESEERLLAATAAVTAVIWTNSAQGLMEGEQPGWGKFTGQSRDEYQGFGWSTAVYPDDAQPTLDAWNRAVAEKHTFVYEHRLRRYDGEWRHCSIRAVPILNTDGTIREWVGVHTDITQRKHDEDKLRELAAEMSQANQRKDEFLATLAHELRNPLAPIRNGLELMKVASGHSPNVEHVRSMMERQLTQMVRLIDDLMDASRISRGRLELQKQRVSLAAVIESALETTGPQIGHMGHQLTVMVPNQPIFVDADSTRLAQVFSNLLSNAAKYSDRDGRIQLKVECEERSVVIKILDDGIGIAADQLTRIFEMFTQAERSLDKSQGGLGIGLSLAKRIVELHGGTIEARSSGLGKGSEFVVNLPHLVEAPEPSSLPHVDESTASLTSRRILVVDDNHDSADSLSALLSLLGYDTRTAYDGREGFDMAEVYRPDLILLDIGLPKLNGYEVCRLIREQVWGKNIVLIALTGWGQIDARNQSKDAGFTEHLVKPVSPEALMKLLGEKGNLGSNPR